MAAPSEASHLEPLKEALHLIMQIVLEDLPGDARVLCVGAGAGAELIALAQALPQAHFVAVDPADEALRQAHERATKAGVVDRCTFHEGPLDTLAPTDPFDAATSILVSHYVGGSSERATFFRGIAQRLRVGGRLIGADRARGDDDAEFDTLLDLWVPPMQRAGFPANRDALRERVVGWNELQRIVGVAGFVPPTQLYQWLLIRGWMAARGDSSVASGSGAGPGGGDGTVPVGGDVADPPEKE